METQLSARPRLTATLPAQQIRLYVVYTFILLLFSLTTCILLLPEAMERLEKLSLFADMKSRVMALGGVFTLTVLFVGPLILFFNAAFRYRAARALDRLGVIAKGSILQKWVDTVDDQPSYRVSYQFKNHLRAWQSIPEDFYETVSPGQDVEILYLEKSPQLSRLEWDEGF